MQDRKTLKSRLAVFAKGTWDLALETLNLRLQAMPGK